MPVLGTIGSASAKGFGMFTGSQYWIGILTGSSTTIAEGVAIDSANNMYICGRTSISGNMEIQLSKYNAVGVIQWQRTLGGATGDFGQSVAVDLSGNVYVCGYVDAGIQGLQIAKYNTDGTIQWQRNLKSVSRTFGDGIAVDSSGNAYVCGQNNTAGFTNSDLQIAKYNTNGVIQWQRGLTGSGSNYEAAFGTAVDSSGNMYICGVSNTGTGDGLLLAKYNTSGAIQWQKRLIGGSSVTGSGIAVDSSANVYVCGTSNTVGTSDIQIAKYNTSGVIQWQRRLANAIAKKVSVDAAGNMYICGSAANNIQIAKYNTSGTIQWQRQLGGSALEEGYGITVNPSGEIWVCGYTDQTSSASFLFAKLPSDGTKTGSYTVGGYSFTYSATTLTDAATTLTDSTSTLTDAATSLTDAATSLTSATSTLTSSVTTI